jgi:threonylcarbamoyladenosine tRNA methylthiotransferase MtaB
LKGYEGYMKKTAALLSLGCKVNSYETDVMRELFETAGYDIVDFKDMADVYVINTCTVTNIADRKSRQMLHKAKKRNPNAVIAAVGCYVQVSGKALLSDSAVDIAVGNNKKSEIVTLVERFKKNKDREEYITDINKDSRYEDLNLNSTMEKTRAFIKIQDGCNRFCTYCIIPYVRGRVRSREEEDILAEITKLVGKGYKEFVLTGIHISSYGTDKITKQQVFMECMPLSKLLIKISQIRGVERIRLGSLEPRIITEDFVKIIAGIKQFCPHFHLSLQSGSNTVLARMNRKYTTEEFYDGVLLIRKYFIHPAFTTDVIVGFPGETDEEFEETKDFVQKVGFSHIHVFKYSMRTGTKAALMTGQIPDETKNMRSNELITLAAAMGKKYKAWFMDKTEKILVEEKIRLDGKNYQIGHNERYEKMAFCSNYNYSNQIIEAQAADMLTDEILFCKIIY